MSRVVERIKASCQAILLKAHRIDQARGPVLPHRPGQEHLELEALAVVLEGIDLALGVASFDMKAAGEVVSGLGKMLKANWGRKVPK